MNDKKTLLSIITNVQSFILKKKKNLYQGGDNWQKLFYRKLKVILVFGEYQEKKFCDT